MARKLFTKAKIKKALVVGFILILFIVSALVVLQKITLKPRNDNFPPESMTQVNLVNTLALVEASVNFKV